MCGMQISYTMQRERGIEVLATRKMHRLWLQGMVSSVKYTYALQRLYRNTKEMFKDNVKAA
jgi:hypothetical protein